MDRIAPDTSARQTRFAMRLSLGFGLLMLAVKFAAYFLTGSAAILSDAAESVVHVVAVGFAAFSLWLISKPADQRFLYGYEKVSFFSAGFEGAMIVLAAIFIIVSAIHKWRAGLALQRLGMGTLFILGASVINLLLGWYLVRVGRRHHSLILEANGKHVLTDSWTSFGVVGGLGLVLWTGWKPFDPLFAIAVAINILFSGGRLVWRSIGGLMDYSDPEAGHALRRQLDAICTRLKLEYHGVRFRSSGQRLMVEVHLLFPQQMPVGEAHRLATLLEDDLAAAMDLPIEVITHLESLEDHGHVHRGEHYTGKPS